MEDDGLYQMDGFHANKSDLEGSSDPGKAQGSGKSGSPEQEYFTIRKRNNTIWSLDPTNVGLNQIPGPTRQGGSPWGRHSGRSTV